MLFWVCILIWVNWHGIRKYTSFFSFINIFMTIVKVKAYTKSLRMKSTSYVSSFYRLLVFCVLTGVLIIIVILKYKNILKTG